jgi:hypothetical protein
LRNSRMMNTTLGGGVVSSVSCATAKASPAIRNAKPNSNPVSFFMDFDLLGRDFDCLEKTCLGKTKDGPDPQEEEAPPEDGRRLRQGLLEVKGGSWGVVSGA